LTSKIISNNLNLWYGEKQALTDISLEIPEKRITALIGPSGCGKSTFIRCLNRMNDLVTNIRIEGQVLYDDIDIYGKDVDVVELRKRIGMVFQKPNPFPMSIYDNIAYGPRIHGQKNISKIVERSLKDSALWEEVSERLDQPALGLSGGQQQKVLIARALAQETGVILLDEPTSNLDIWHQIDVMEIMREVTRRQNAAMIIAVHDLNLAYRYADVIVMLDHGTRVGYGKPDDVLTPADIERVYGVTACMVENEYGRFLLPVRKSGATVTADQWTRKD